MCHGRYVQARDSVKELFSAPDMWVLGTDIGCQARQQARASAH